MGSPRVVALLATYNERRFIGGCLEHLHAQGVETYLIDNCSTDETVAIAERHLGRGLIGIEQFPRNGVYDWRALLRRKEQLAGELEADWFIHLDADEVRLPPPGQGTLAEALGAVDREGYNAVNFLEFTFVPTREAPDHDHPDFRRTLRTYYPFCPSHPHKLTAWKASAAPKPDLASSGGHRVDFPGVRMSPQSFPMKHYLFLSVPHAVEKYVERHYDPDEVESGWHGWRATVTAEDIRLPSERELRIARSDDDLDPGEPRKAHCVDTEPKRRSGRRGSRSDRPGEEGATPIVQYWHSEEIPHYIAERVAGFGGDESGLPHRLFDERSAGELIAERFGDRHAEAFAACAIPAMQSDYLRYCAIHALGGVYVDADFGFRRSLRSLFDVEGQFFGLPPREPVLSGLFAFRSPGHPFLEMAIEVSTTNIENRVTDSSALAAGPAVATGLLQMLQGGSLEALRDLAGPHVKPHLDACWEAFVESFNKAVTDHPAGRRALAGIRVSSRAEMLTWVERPKTELPYKRTDSYWANWKGSAFRTPGGAGSS